MRFIIYALLLTGVEIFASGCDSNSEIKNGLSYEEYIQKAQQLESNGNSEKAIIEYKKALKIRPDDGKTHYALGRLYDSEGQRSYEDAFNRYQVDVLSNSNKKRNKDQTKELEVYGFKSKYHKLALHEYEETIKYSPENSAARYFIATEYLNAKQYKQAILEYNNVVKYNPENSVAYSQLGKAYLEIGYCNSAIDNFTKAFKLDSNAESYYYDVGRVYVKLNNTEKTIEMINRLKDSKYYYDLTGYQPNGKCLSVEEPITQK